MKLIDDAVWLKYAFIILLIGVFSTFSSGMDTAADGSPLPYPAACSPQAWSAGAPLLLLRAALGLDPDDEERRIDDAFAIPAGTQLVYFVDAGLIAA